MTDTEIYQAFHKLAERLSKVVRLDISDDPVSRDILERQIKVLSMDIEVLEVLMSKPLR